MVIILSIMDNITILIIINYSHYIINIIQLFTRATHGKEDHRQRAAVLRQVDPLQVAAQRVRRVPRRDDALPRTDQEGHRPGLRGKPW